MGMGSGTKGSGQSQYQSPQQSGFSGKGGGMNAPYNNGGMGGKGGQIQNPYYQQAQGGLGGKGKGGAQQQFQQPIQQSVYQPPVQQNPYASAYFQSQFRPQTFNNPFAQGGFGQQPQGEMSGFGGKGGQMTQSAAQQPQAQPPQVQQLQSEAIHQFPRGGMGGKGAPMGENTLPRSRAMFGSIPIQRDPKLEQLMQDYRQQMMQPRRFGGIPIRQQTGLAALAQPTATTEAATPAPEQPYMGNYLQ